MGSKKISVSLGIGATLEGSVASAFGASKGQLGSLEKEIKLLYREQDRAATQFERADAARRKRAARAREGAGLRAAQQQSAREVDASLDYLLKAQQRVRNAGRRGANGRVDLEEQGKAEAVFKAAQARSKKSIDARNKADAAVKKYRQGVKGAARDELALGKTTQQLSQKVKGLGDQADKAGKQLSLLKEKNEQKAASEAKRKASIARKLELKNKELELNEINRIHAKFEKKRHEQAVAYRKKTFDNIKRIGSFGLSFIKYSAMATTAVGAVGGAVLGVLLKIEGAVNTRMRNIRNGAKSFGISITNMQGMRVAGRENGIAGAQIDSNLRSFLDNTNKAMMGQNKRGLDAMQRLGINPADLRGKSRDEGVMALLDAIERNKGNANAGQYLRTLAGNGGERLKTLTGGRAGFQKNLERWQKSGEVVGDEGMAKAQKFDEELTKLKGKFEGIQNTFGISMMEPFTKAVEVATKLITENMPKIQEVADRFGNALQSLVNDGSIEQWLIRIGKAAEFALEIIERLAALQSDNKKIKEGREAALSQKEAAKKRADQVIAEQQAIIKRADDRFNNMKPNEQRSFQLTSEEKVAQLRIRQEQLNANIARNISVIAGTEKTSGEKIETFLYKGGLINFGYNALKRKNNQNALDDYSKEFQEITQEIRRIREADKAKQISSNITNNVTVQAAPGIDAAGLGDAVSQAVSRATNAALNHSLYDLAVAH